MHTRQPLVQGRGLQRLHSSPPHSSSVHTPHTGPGRGRREGRGGTLTVCVSPPGFQCLLFQPSLRGMPDFHADEGESSRCSFLHHSLKGTGHRVPDLVLFPWTVLTWVSRIALKQYVVAPPCSCLTALFERHAETLLRLERFTFTFTSFSKIGSGSFVAGFMAAND